MNLAQHRLIAGTILVAASVGVGITARGLIRDSPTVAAARHQLEGRWVAGRVATSTSPAVEGGTAAATVEFAGQAVRFTGLIDGGDSAGTYVLEPQVSPAGIDCKLDVGWVRGVYRRVGNQLTLSLNAIRPLEHLGVPSRGYAQDFEPTGGRFVYEFRRAD